MTLALSGAGDQNPPPEKSAREGPASRKRVLRNQMRMEFGVPPTGVRVPTPTQGEDQGSLLETCAGGGGGGARILTPKSLF